MANQTLGGEQLDRMVRERVERGGSTFYVLDTMTPGFVATEVVAAKPEKALERIEKQIPVRRLCRPGRSPASSLPGRRRFRLHHRPARCGVLTVAWTFEGAVSR